jgi:Bardet-Biedl syndrome 9 protein
VLREPLVLAEFVGEGAMSGTSSAAGFHCYGGSGSTVTVLAAKSSQRYRLQCDTLPPLCLLTSQLVERLNRHFSRHEDFTCSYSSSLPLHELFSEIGTHFLLREKAGKVQVSAGEFMSVFSSLFTTHHFLHILSLLLFLVHLLILLLSF